MLKKSNFTSENIRRLQNDTGNDPALLERTLFAFALLEALSLSGLDFIFKGGTSLMLVLDEPRRLSIDIDIIVRPDIDIEKHIEKAALTFPFIRYDEQIRRKQNNIKKRHFKFYYISLLNQRELSVILDVVFEENHYLKSEQRAINHALIEVELPIVSVCVPSIDAILGDKLTAFAPHTIGIPFGTGKDMEIIKQFFDIAILFDMIDDFSEVKNTYERSAKLEIEYRGLDNIDVQKTLLDSFGAAIAIIGRGKLYNDDYEKLLDGIRRVKSFIIGGSYSPTVAEKQACRVVYLIANILANNNELRKIPDAEAYAGKYITNPQYAKLNHIKKTGLPDFAYLYEAILLLGNDLRNISSLF